MAMKKWRVKCRKEKYRIMWQSFWMETEDGRRRKECLPRNYGHVQGAKRVEDICEEAYRMGIRYLTVYAFSTENWNRPQDEVDALMGLLRNYMKTCLRTAAKNNMCVRVLGDKTRLDEDIRNRIDQLEKSTRASAGPRAVWRNRCRKERSPRRRSTRSGSAARWIRQDFLNRIF